MWTLHKRIVSQSKGSPDDGSESWESKVSFILVRYDEEDEFGESVADDCGSQDYSYRVDYQRLFELRSEDELKKLMRCVNERVFFEKIKDDGELDG